MCVTLKSLHSLCQEERVMCVMVKEMDKLLTRANELIQHRSNCLCGADSCVGQGDGKSGKRANLAENGLSVCGWAASLGEQADR